MSDTVNLRDAVLNKEDTILTSRRDKFWLRFRMFNDNYKDQVLTKLKEIYLKSEEIRLDKQLDLTNNIYKTIIEKISRVYAFGVSRTIGSDTLEDYYNTGIVDKTMKQANIYVNAFNDVLLQVSWNDNKQEPKLIFRLPHKTEVVLNGNDELKEVEYFVETVEDGKKEKWAFWSDTEHYYKIYNQAHDKFEIMAVEGNEEKVNPLGVLPFVSIQNGFRDGSYWDTFTGDDLTQITLDDSIYNTFKNYMIKWQSFKQMVITGENLGDLGGQGLDPSKAITVTGEGAAVSILDLQANIKELQEVIAGSSNNVAINYNISPNQFRLTGQVSSGFALQMENTELDKFTVEQQRDFVGYEKELNNLLIIVYDKMGSKNVAGDFEAEIIEPNYSESRLNTLEANEKAIQLGLRSAIEIIANDRGVSEDEAKLIYAENLRIRNESNSRLNQGTLNIDTTANALNEANE